MVVVNHCGVQTQAFEFLRGCRLVSGLWALPVPHPTPGKLLAGSSRLYHLSRSQEAERPTGTVFGDLWGCFLRTRSLRTSALQSQKLLGRP